MQCRTLISLYRTDTFAGWRVKNDHFGWVGAVLDGRYEIEAVAGEGAFGVVYRATHIALAERVAVKCLKVPAALDEAERASFVGTFRDEARLMLRLSRETTGIVQAHDVGAAVSPRGLWCPFLVMDWLEGETLEDELFRRASKGVPARSIPEAIALLTPAAHALAVAHAAGVAHRDFKPANLFLAKGSTGEARLKILDFGIAKILRESPTLTAALANTGTSIQAFTPKYGAPEQFNPKYGATGPWTDVFALALVLLEVAAGQPALPGETILHLHVAACDPDARPSFARLGLNADAALEKVVAKSVEVQPANRYRTAAQMWGEIEAAAGAALARTHAAPVQPEPPARIVAPEGTAAPAPPPPSGRGDSRGRTGAASARLDEVEEGNRLCTIVFADVSGFTALSERLPPEQVKEVMDRCFDVLTECIERFGGRVDKFIGDCVMAVFGVPRATDNDAERAIHAALEMQAALDKLATGQRGRRALRLTLRTGINTGRVFAGRVGGGERRDFTVMGDAVNVASRLQHHAPAASIVIGHATHRHVVGLFNVEELPPFEAKGKSEPLLAYRVLGPTTVRQALPPTDFYGLETKFVGRGVELSRLVESLETTIAESRAQLITVVGPPGLGRSRVLAELYKALSMRPEFLVVMTATCPPLSVDTSYALAAALLRMRFRVNDDDAPEVIAHKLRRGVKWFLRTARSGATSGAAERATSDDALFDEETHGEQSGHAPHADVGEADDPAWQQDLEQALDAIPAVFAGAHELASSPDSIAPDEGGSHAKARVSAALARMLGAIAGRAPVVILCDDVQWADDASLDVIDELVVRCAEQRVLVVCAARPELYERRPGWGEGKMAHGRVDLAPLARRHVEEMARDRLRPVPEIQGELVQRLVDRAEGNPRILNETLHLLIDAGAIERRSDDVWEIHPDRTRTLALPGAVEGIVQARLDRLDPDARTVLSCAAVVGRAFWIEAVDPLRSVAHDKTADATAETALAGAPGAPVPSSTAEALARLRDRQLVRLRDPSTFPGLREYVFVESSTQEVAYEALSLRTRRRLHREHARWLLERIPGDGGAALCAVHFDRGGDPRRALAEYARAGAHAAALGQNAEALRHFERARQIHDEATAGASEPITFTEDADELRIASWQDRTRLRLDLGDVLRRLGRLEAAETSYEEAKQRVLSSERRAGESLDPRESHRYLARVHFRLALVQHVRGATKVARKLAERAIDEATAAGAIEETAELWLLLAMLSRRERDFAGSRAAALRGLRACRMDTRRNERWREATAQLLVALGAVLNLTGKAIGAERCFLQASRLVDDKTSPHALGTVLNHIGVGRFMHADYAGAREVLRRSLAVKERAGDLHQIAIAHNNVAETELRLGQPAQALVHAKQGVALLERLGAEALLTDALRNLAEALSGVRQHAAALSAGSRALDLVRGGAGKFHKSEVVVSLCRVCNAAWNDAAATSEIRSRVREVGEAVGTELSRGDGVDERAREAFSPIESLLRS